MFLNKKKTFDHRFSCNNSYCSIKRLNILTLILNNFLYLTFFICCILICLMLLRYKVEKFNLFMRVILNIKHILCLSIHFNLNVFICCNFQCFWESLFSLKPTSPKGDQHLISPYNVNKETVRPVRRIALLILGLDNREYRVKKINKHLITAHLLANDWEIQGNSFTQINITLNILFSIKLISTQYWMTDSTTGKDCSIPFNWMVMQ